MTEEAGTGGGGGSWLDELQEAYDNAVQGQAGGNVGAPGGGGWIDWNMAGGGGGGGDWFENPELAAWARWTAAAAAPPPAAPPEPEWIAWQQTSPPWTVGREAWSENPELAAWSRWREAQLAQEREELAAWSQWAEEHAARERQRENAELAAWGRWLGGGGPGEKQRSNWPMPLPTAEPWGPISGPWTAGSGQKKQGDPWDTFKWLNMGGTAWPTAEPWQPMRIKPDHAIRHALRRNAHASNEPGKDSRPTGHLACIDVNCDLVQNARTGNVKVANARNPVYKLIQEISRGNTSAANALDRVLAQTSGTGDLREIVPDTVERRIDSGVERLRRSPLRDLAVGIEAWIDPRLETGTGTHLRDLGAKAERGIEPAIDSFLGGATRTHFRGLGASRGDEGFRRDMADDYLYGTFWGERLPYSRQLGHFLTAVDMGRAGRDWWKWLVLGHEQAGDQEGPGRQITTPTADDLAAFDLAVERDLAGDYAGRDAALHSILDPDKHGPLAGRRGNSLEDLRLSVRGWALGRLVATRKIRTNRELANWIALHVAGD